MSKDKNREDKFTWKPGEFDVQVSQCSKCDNNIGINDCIVYGEKPIQFRLNDEKCPSREE